MDTDEAPGNLLRAPAGDGTLGRALTELARRLPPSLRPQADELRCRFDEGQLRIVVIGEAKRGKSTLINALLGRSVLPTGVVPVTAVTTHLVYAARDGLDVQLLDGTRRPADLGELAALVTEAGNPSNRSGVASVVVRLDSPMLASGIELVDTPGTGSVFAHNTASAREAMGAMDVAVLVLTADAPMSSAERDLLRAAAAGSVRVFCVLNKADYLTDDDRYEAMEFIARNVEEALGTRVPVYACSARSTDDAGLRAFRSALVSELDPVQDLAASVASTARRLATAALDSIAITSAALVARDQQSEDQLARFRERLAVTTRKADQVPDIVAALSGGLLRDLNDASTQVIARLRTSVQERLTTAFAAELADTATAQLEDEARALVADDLRPGLDQWRDAGRRMLDDGLRAISERLTRDLDEDLDDVRQAARELLGIDLALEAPPVTLPDQGRFFYTLVPEPAQSELTARAVRRHLPGSLGRRRIEDRVHADARRIVDAQVGRVRADLQERLGEASRALARRCATQYEESVGALAEAMSLAATSRQGTRAEATAALTSLRSDRDALAGVLRTLDDLHADLAAEGQRA